MVNVIIVTQARIGSSRLPGKVLKKIDGKSILEIHLERIKKSKYGNNLILATTKENGVEEIIDIANASNVKYFKGDTEDVLNRFYQATLKFNPDFIVRLTSDCPLIDPLLIDTIIDSAIKYNKDYTTNTLIEEFPDGQDVEVIKWSAFQEAWEKSDKKYQKEHVTPYVRENSTFFDISKFSSMHINSKVNYSNVRMTIDQHVDFDALKILINHLGFNADWKTYTKFILKNPSLFPNQRILRNAASKN
mgnify:CR=1 FL=1|tara:strand:+ start:222 stop:962 length:741 start_codon:yes stop_codon:yes gene_type:complete